MERARRDADATFPEGGHLTGCGCSTSKIAVRSDGVYIPCTMLSAIELGRINEDPLVEIWRGSPALQRLRRRHLIALAQFEECRACDYRPYCTGNCPGLAFSLTGEADRPSPDACLKKFLSEGGILPGPVVT
jgi:SynChlorMet cassette radical SAM/SPASM protein ScmE